MTYRGHKGRVTALYEECGILYSGSQDCSVKLWSAGTGDLLFTLEKAHANEVCLDQYCIGSDYLSHATLHDTTYYLFL